MQNLEYLFAAYAVIWLAIFFYTYTLRFRQNKLEQELDRLSQIVEGKTTHRVN